MLLKNRSRMEAMRHHFAQLPALHRTSSREMHATDARSRSIDTFAVGSLAIGAMAIGALAIGALAIGRLAVGRARVRRLVIDELVVGRLRVTDQLDLPASPMGGRPGTNER